MFEEVSGPLSLKCPHAYPIILSIHLCYFHPNGKLILCWLFIWVWFSSLLYPSPLHPQSWDVSSVCQCPLSKDLTNFVNECMNEIHYLYRKKKRSLIFPWESLMVFPLWERNFRYYSLMALQIFWAEKLTLTREQCCFPRTRGLTAALFSAWVARVKLPQCSASCLPRSYILFQAQGWSLGRWVSDLSRDSLSSLKIFG